MDAIRCRVSPRKCHSKDRIAAALGTVMDAIEVLRQPPLMTGRRPSVSGSFSLGVRGWRGRWGDFLAPFRRTRREKSPQWTRPPCF